MNKRLMKRILSVFLAAIMLFSAVPQTATAAGTIDPNALVGEEEGVGVQSTTPGLKGTGTIDNPFIMHIGDQKDISKSWSGKERTKWVSDSSGIVDFPANDTSSEKRENATTVTAQKVGEVSVYLKYYSWRLMGSNWHDFSGTTGKLYFKVLPTPVTSVVVEATEPTAILVGSSIQLNATCIPTEESNQQVTWSSDTPAIATVDQRGLVTLNSTGVATLRATSVVSPESFGTIQVSSRELNTLTITFDANGGTGVPSPIQILEGQPLGNKMPSGMPVKTGNDIFSGWFTQASGGTKIDQNFSTTSNVTVYAHWTSVSGIIKDLPVAAGPDDQGNVTGLQPGEVAAHKDAQWEDYDARIAKITFDMQGVAVRKGSDVIIVVDRSGSMNGARMTSAKAAVNKLTNQILANSNIDNNRVALVPFDDETSQSVNFQINPAIITTKMNSISAADGTDYQVAFNQAIYYASTRTASEQSRPLYIVFISDGKPASGRGGASQASVLKSAGATIFSVGIQIASTNDAAKDALKAVSSTNSFTNVVNLADLDPVLANVGAQIKKAATNAILTDIIDDKFDIISNDSTYPLPAGTIVNGQTVTITVGDIIEQNKQFVIYVRLKTAYQTSPDIYPTNDGVRLDYTDVNQMPAFKDQTVMGEPAVNVAVGSINVKYVLVNKQGEYINYAGVVLTPEQEAFRVIKAEVPYTVNGSPQLLVSAAGISYQVGQIGVPVGYTVYQAEPTTKSVVLTHIDSTKTVEYKVFAAKYDIRWVDYNDDLLYTSEDVPYGQIPVYGGPLLERAPANGYKYEFSNWTPNVVAVTGVQTYKAEYTQSDDYTQRKNINYDVEYWIEGHASREDVKSVSASIWVNENATSVTTIPGASFIGIEGYKLKETAPVLPAMVENNGVVKATYEKDQTVVKDISFNIVHRIVGDAIPVLQDPRTVSVWINDTLAPVGTIGKLVLPGYKFQSFELGGTESQLVPKFVEDDQTIYVNYVRDNDQLKTISYKVEHYVGDEATPRDTDTITQQVWLGTSPEILDAKPIEYKTYEGYKKVVGPLLTEVAANAVIRVNYEKDEAQQHLQSYTVDIYFDNVLQSELRDIVNENVWILSNELNFVNKNYETAEYLGYKFSHRDPVNVSTTVANNSTIKYYFEKDEAQTKNLSYSVVYTIDGVRQTPDVITKAVWVNAADTLNVDSFEIKTFVGYQTTFTSAMIPATIGNGGEIIIDYVKDDTITKDVSYTLKFTFDGVERVGSGEVYTDTIWINDASELAVRPIKAIDTLGYLFDYYKVNGEQVTSLPAKLNHNDILTVAYKKDAEATKTVSYDLQFAFDGIIKAEYTKHYEQQIWVLDVAEMATKPLVSVDTTGYKFKSYEVNGVEVTEIPTTVNSETIIRVNYEKDDTVTKSIPYSVQYFKNTADGYVLADTKEMSKTVWINAPDTVLVDSVPDADFAGFGGYKKVNTIPILPETIAKNGVIKLYYDEDRTVTKEITYNVVHRIIGNVAPEKTESRTATIWINDTLAPVTAIDKLVLPAYKFDSFELGGSLSTLAPNFVGDEQTIYVNYVRDDAQVKLISYKVEHYVGDEVTPRDTDTVIQQVWLGTSPEILTVEPIDYKTYVGYKKVVGTLLSEVAANAVIRVNYEIDEEQTKELSYSIINTLNGVRQTPVVKTKTVWINDLEVNVDRFEIPVILGYKTSFTQDQIPEMIKDGGEIIIDYVTDSTQTVPVSYTVVRIANGVEIGRDSYPGTVQVLAPRVITVGTINVPTYAGFTTDFNAAALAGTSVADGTVFTITYTAIPVVPVVIPTPAPTPAPVVIPTPETPQAPTPEVTPEEIVTPETPQAEEPSVDIKDEETPKAEAPISWALVNLILMILTAITSILLLVGYFIKKREDENRVVEEERELKRRGLVRLISILPAVGAIVAFFLTENVFNPMIMLDQWTLLMAIIALIQVVICFFSIKKWNENDEHQQNEKINA